MGWTSLKPHWIMSSIAPPTFIHNIPILLFWIKLIPLALYKLQFGKELPCTQPQPKPGPTNQIISRYAYTHTHNITVIMAVFAKVSLGTTGRASFVIYEIIHLKLRKLWAIANLWFQLLCVQQHYNSPVWNNI